MKSPTAQKWKQFDQTARVVVGVGMTVWGCSGEMTARRS